MERQNEVPDSSPRLWRVGTLAYTTGGLVILFSWLLWGDFAWSMKERSVAQVVQLLLKKFQASDTMMGLLLGTIPAAIGVLIGPVISYRSDRHRGRWGRRIPFLVITTPIAALSMVGLAFSPRLGNALHALLGAHSPGTNGSILLLFGLFWTLFEIATIAANAVFGGLINDVVPAALLGRFYGLFRALSLIAGMIFNYWLLEKAEVHFAWLFIGIGALYAVGFTIMCVKVKEGEYPPPPAVEVGPEGSFVAAARVYCKDSFSHPYYLWLFVFLTISGLAFVPVNMFSIIFAKALPMDMGRYGRLIALTYAISLALSYFLGALADRFHPLRVGIITLIFYAAATLWGGIYATSVNSFSIAFIAHVVLSGTFFTTTASLPQRLFPHAKFAQYCSAYMAISAVCGLVLGPAVGRMLDLSGHLYRYTYYASCGLTVLALVSSIFLYRGFNALGGTKNYAAPQ